MDRGGTKSSRSDSGSQDVVGGFLRHVAHRAVLPYLVLGIALLAAAVMLGREIDRHFAEIQSWIQGTGSWGLLVYVGLFVLATSLLVPDSVLCVLGGVLFDLKSAIAATIIAMFVSSVLQFALSHRLLRPRIQRMLTRRPALEELHGAILHDELYLQVLLRLTPLNPATLTYVLGAIGVRFSRFLIACATLIPALIIEVYIGHASRHIARLATGGVPSARLHDVLVIVGLVMCVVAFVAVSRLARKAIARAVARAEAAEGGHNMEQPDDE